jgi:meso-butanediol dehydrogenase / (S,S)-butanediol dehydrogenase / diacetyl reductase
MTALRVYGAHSGTVAALGATRQDLVAMGVSSAPGKAMKNFPSTIPLGRAAQPGDVVGTIRFLASPASDYMTGQVLMIDGGMILQ